MLKLETIRQRYPSARNLTDGELVSRLSEITQRPFEEVAQRFGVGEDMNRGVVGALNDYAIEGANAAAGVVKAVSDFASPGNRVSQFIDQKIIEPGLARQSVPTQIAKRRLGAALQTDEIGPQLRGVYDYVTENPVLAGAQALGSFGPLGLGVKTSQYLARGAGLGVKASERVGLATGAGLSGAASGGDAGGSAYELVKATPWNVLSQHPQAAALIEQGMDQEAIYEELATRAARRASVAPALVGVVAGATGAEKALTGGVRGFRGVASTTAKETGTEALEEGTTQFSGRAAASEYNPDINPMEGVVGSAALGGALGAGVALPISLAQMQPVQDSRSYDLTQRSARTPPRAPAAPAAPTGSITDTDPTSLLGNPMGDPLAGGNPLTPTAPTAPAEPPAPSAVWTPTEQALMDRFVRPSKKAGELYEEAQKLGIPMDSDTLVPFWTSLAENKFKKARDALADAVIELKKAANGQSLPAPAGAPATQTAAPDATAITAPPATTQGSAGAAPATAPVLDPAGQSADAPAVAQPVVSSGGDATIATRSPAPAPAGVGASSTGTNGTQTTETVQAEAQGQAPETLRRAAAGQPAAGAATQSVEAAGPQPLGTAPRNLLTLRKRPAQTDPTAELEDTATLEALTGNVGNASAVLEEVTDQRRDADQSATETIRTILTKRFEKSENPARDAEIALAYLTALRGAPRGSKIKVQEAIAAKYGITPVAVRKVGNTTPIVEAARQLGYTPAETRALLEVADNSKESGATEETGSIAEALTALGVETEEGDTAGFGFDDSRTWSAPEDTAEAKANAVQSIMEQQDALAATIAELVEQGQNEVAATLIGQQQVLKDKLVATLADYQKLLDGGKKKPEAAPVPQAPVVDEATKAAKQRLREVGGDVRALTDQELPLILAEYRRLNNDAGAARTAKVMAERGLTVPDAPAKPAAPEAKAEKPKAKVKLTKQGPKQDSGQTLWEKLREQTPELADYDSLTANEKGFLTELADRTKGKPVLAKEAGLQQLISDRLVGEDVDGQYGKGERASNPYTADELLAELKDFMRADIPGRKLLVVDSVADLLADPNPEVRKIGAALALEGAYGVAVDGRAYLIANRINKGAGRAKFMHEVGAHLGLENLLPADKYTSLVERVKAWAKADDGSLESELALRAVERVQNADTPAEDRRAELLAYFVEEAVEAGIDPTADQSTGGLAQWFRSLWSAFAAALRRLGARPETLNAQDVVNLAFGAAQLELDSATTPARQRMRFGKPAPTAGAVQSNIAKLPKPMRGPLRNTLATIKDWTNKGLDRVVFTSDLIKRASDAGIKSAKTFAETLAARANKARELEREVEQIADMYADVPDVDKGAVDSVNDFLFESTRTGKWGYGKDADKEMAAKFDALQPASQAFVKAVFEHGDRMLKLKKQTVMDHTNTEYDALIKAAKDAVAKAATQAEKDAAQVELNELTADKANAIKKFQGLFSIREGKPYAPIKRMGNFAVVAKSDEYMDAEARGDDKELRKLEQDPDHYHVSFVESKGEARRLSDNLKEQGFFNDNVDFFERNIDSENSLFRGTDLQALTRMRAAADSKASAGAKGAAQLQRLITDMYLQSLAENSARKSELRRRGVPGEVDMLRSFAAQGRADAQFVASVEFNPRTQEALQAIEKESSVFGNRERTKELRNELVRRYEQSLEMVHTPVLDKLTRMTSVYFLATSPAYYLQNLTQPWMMSVPAMAGNHSYAKVTGELWSAYSQLAPVMKSAKLFSQGFDFSRVPDDVREPIMELVNRGRIDIGLDTELGEFRIEGEGAFTDTWNKIDKGLRMAVQKTEAINRLSTAIAAYRLELSKTGSPEQALDYADNILMETHGDYSRFNAPRAFNTNVGRLALQFRKFQLIQLTFYAKLIRDAFSGKDRAVAMKTLSYALGHTALLAGVVGLPGYTAIAWALGHALGDDDEKYDLTYELRKLIGDGDVANMILRGTPTLAGADISGKVGAGTMLSIMPFSNADLSTPQGRAEAFGTLIGGATLGMTSRMLDGLGLMLSGDPVRGLEFFLPKGLGDAIKAARTSEEGMTRRNGDVLLPAEEVSAVESLMQAIGIAPVDQTTTFERRTRAFDMERRFRDRTTSLKNKYTAAVKDGDRAEMAKLRTEWNEMQQARVRNGFKRQPLSDLLRAPIEQRKRERATIGGVQTNRSNRAFAEEQAEL